MSTQITHAAKEKDSVAEAVNQSVVKIHDMANRAASDSENTITLTRGISSVILRVRKYDVTV